MSKSEFSYHMRQDMITYRLIKVERLESDSGMLPLKLF